MPTQADYQYEVNGLLIGKNTPYKVTAIDGLFSLPDVVNDDSQREMDDGERSSDLETLSGRTITIDLTMLDDDVVDTTDDLYEELQAATSDIRRQFPFLIKRPGRPERYISVKVRRRAFTANYDFSMGMGGGSLQLKALDPRIYSSEVDEATTGAAVSVGGMTFPIVPPVVFTSGGSAGTVNALNEGTYPSPAVLTISGPVINPMVEHIEQGRVLSYNGTLASDETLVIDLGKRTVLLNGVANRRNLMTKAQWFLLDPGDNTLRLSGAQGFSPAVNMVLNPSMETATGTLVVRQNLMFNPVVAANTASWAAFAGTGGTNALARQTGQAGWAYGVSTSARGTWSVASTAVNGGLIAILTANIVATKTYSAAVQVRCNKVQRVQIRIDWYASGGGGLGSTANVPTVLAANTVTTLNLTGVVAPATATQCQVIVESAVGTSGTVWAIADWLEATNCHVEETDQVLAVGGVSTPVTGTFTGAFSAGSYSPDYTFTWAGAADASISEMRAPSLDNYQAGASTDVPSTRSTEVPAKFGAYSQRIRWATAAVNAQGDAQSIPVIIGNTYTYSRYVWVPAGSPEVCLSIDSTGTSPNTGGLRDQWVRQSMTFVAVANPSVIRVLCNAAATKGDDRCYSDGAMLEPGVALNTYSDDNNPRFVPLLTAEWRSAWV